MRWSIPFGRLFGIKVEVHVTFLLFVAFVAINPNALAITGSSNPLRAVILVLLAFTFVLLHELGHALAARRYGIRTRDIILLPFGGVARLERMPEKPQQEIVVAVAGPFVNLVFGVALGALLGRSGLSPSMRDAIGFLFVINAGMLLFNLIPAFPMDGGRVLRALLALWIPYVRATRIAATIGQGFAVLMMGAGLLNFGRWPWLAVIGLFLFFVAGEERSMVQTRSSLAGLPVRAAMLTDFHWLGQGDPLRRAVEFLMAGSQQDFPVLDGQRLVGLLTRADLIRALQQRGADTPVSEAMAAEVDVADASEALEDVVMRMRAGSHTAVPVLSQGRLVGLLTLENVGDLLLVRDALHRWATTAT